MKRPKQLVWFMVDWVRPFDFEQVCGLVTHLSGLTHRQAFVWEIRLTKDSLRYLLGVDVADRHKIKALFSAHGSIQFTQVHTDKRSNLSYASRLNIRHAYFSLNTDRMEALTRSFLASSSLLHTVEAICLQLTIGRSRPPKPIPKDLPNPTSTWFQRISNHVPPLSSDSQKWLKQKLHHAQFQAEVRLGVHCDHPIRARQLHQQLLSSLRIMESNGARLHLSTISPQKLNEAQIPWHFPTYLSAIELANLLLLPIGEGDFPHLPLRPITILPPLGYMRPSNDERSFGETLEASPRPLHIRPQDALSHTQLIAPTGSGKSVVMTQLALKDIEAGRSVLVLDGKQDTILQLLERIPKHRHEDVVILDATAEQVVGINPFDLVRYGVSPALISDWLLQIFESLFPDNFGIRSRDVLLASFMTLAQTPQATLLMLPRLLSDHAFRQQLVKQLNDPIGVESFWRYYDQLSLAERHQLVAPSLNKLRQLFNRPQLRAILGQTQSKFSLMELFTQRKIVLMSLNQGVIGAQTAQLLGNIITTCLHALTLKRADIPLEKRHPVMVYIDEFPSYLSVASQFEESLAMARSLGVGYTLAHQTLSQLPSELKAAIEANCKQKIVFGLSMSDAREIARQTLELTAEDIHALPMYQIYARPALLPQSWRWVSGRTYPLPPKKQDASALYAKSLARYGCHVSDIEQQLRQQLSPKEDELSTPQQLGRRKRATTKGESL
ncbi:type IV secretory system conjugative DNA transfer family protein [Aerococcaceae bacterium NML180378]|nr:type IV secretory system conjugative DNA transfer family protein [Aerococcaceae bacterium NML180378]